MLKDTGRIGCSALTDLVLKCFSDTSVPRFWITPLQPGRVAQSVGHLTRKPGDLGSIPGLATYFRFSFRFFKKDVVSYWRRYTHEVLVNR